MLKKDGSGRKKYFTGLETALAHVKQSFKEMAEAEEKTGISDSKKTGDFVRWVNAYKALGGTVQDISKVLPDVDVEGIVSQFMEKMGDSYKRYTVDKFKETFGIFQELMEKMPKFQPEEFSTSFNETAKQVEEAADRIVESIEKIKEKKPKVQKIKAEDIIASDEIEGRIADIKRQLKEVSDGILAKKEQYSKLGPEPSARAAESWLKGHYSSREIKEILQGLFELERYYDEIDKKAEKTLEDQYRLISSVFGITDEQEEAMITKGTTVAERRMRSVKSSLARGTVAQVGESTEPVERTVDTLGRVESAADGARDAVGEVGDAMRSLDEEGGTSPLPMVSRLDDLKQKLREAKEQLEDFQRQQAQAKEEFDVATALKGALDNWYEYGKKMPDPQAWLVKMVRDHIEEGKMPKAAAYYNLLRSNYKEDPTQFLGANGEVLNRTLHNMSLALIPSYEKLFNNGTISNESLNQANEQVRKARERVEELQRLVREEEKLARQAADADASVRRGTTASGGTGTTSEEIGRQADDIEEGVNRIKNAISAEEITSPEILTQINTFINSMVEQFQAGSVEVDDAVQRIKDRLQELKVEAERKDRIRTQLSIFEGDAKPILSDMGVAEGEYPQSYIDLITQIKEESITGSEALHKFAESVGYAYSTAANMWHKVYDQGDGMSSIGEAAGDSADKVVRSQEEIQAEIDETNKRLQIQRDWIDYLSKTKREDRVTGKRAATDELRSATRDLTDYRKHQEEYDESEPMRKQRVTVRWWRAMEQAKYEGVAESVLTRYKTDITEDDYNNALNDVLNELERAEERSKEIYGRIQELKQELYHSQYKDNVKQIREAVSLDEMTPEISESMGAFIEDMVQKYRDGAIGVSDAVQSIKDKFAELKAITQEVAIPSITKKITDAFASLGNISIDPDYVEKFVIANTKTGYHISPAEGTYDFISQKIVNSAIENAEEAVDTMIHTHSEKIAAFSHDDIYSAIEEMGKSIVHQFVVSQDEVSYIDFSKLGKNTWKLIAEDFEKRYEKLLETDGWDSNVQPTQEMLDEFQKKMRAALKHSIAFITGKGDDFAESIYKTFPLSEIQKEIDNVHRIREAVSPDELTPEISESMGAFIEDMVQKYRDGAIGVSDAVQSIKDKLQELKDASTSSADAFQLRSSSAPEELKSTVEELEAAITDRGMPFEQALERLNGKAKELGYTFDEITGKWLKLSSSAAVSAFEDFQREVMDYRFSDDMHPMIPMDGGQAEKGAYNTVRRFLSTTADEILRLQREYDEFDTSRPVSELEDIERELRNLQVTFAGTYIAANDFWEGALDKPKGGASKKVKELYDSLMSGRYFEDVIASRNGKIPSGGTSMSISDVSSIDQLSDYIKQLEIAKATAEELKAIMSKADEFGGLSSLPADQIAELTKRMRELGIVAEETRTAEEGVGEGAQQAASGVAPGRNEQGGVTSSSEAQRFSDLGQAINEVKTLISDKNELIQNEIDLVNGSIPFEIQLFDKLSEAIRGVAEQLGAIMQVLPYVDFDSFAGQATLTKIGQLAIDIASLTNTIDALDNIDSFSHLNEILNTPDQGLTTNLDTINQKFRDLKDTMNNFDSNGVAVFKSISDLANAGDALVSKMSKLFKDSGVKLADATAAQAKSKERAQALLTEKEPEIRSAVGDFLMAQPGAFETVVKELKVSGNGIVQVVATVKRALEDGKIAFDEYKLAVSDTASGLSIAKTGMKSDDKSVTSEIAKQQKEVASLEKQIDQAFKRAETAKESYISEYKKSLIAPGTNDDALASSIAQYLQEIDTIETLLGRASSGKFLNGSFFFDDYQILEWLSMLERFEESISASEQGASISQRAKDVDELAKSYSKLAEIEHKIDESRKNGLKQQQEDLEKQKADIEADREARKARLGTLTPEETEIVQRGVAKGEELRKTLGMDKSDISRDFVTAEKGYETLIEKAEQYWKIQAKIQNGKTLTVGDQTFLANYGKYFEDAANGIGIFTDKSKEAIEAKERFEQVNTEAQGNIIDNQLYNIESAINRIELPQNMTKAFESGLEDIKAKFEKIKELAPQVKVGNEAAAKEYKQLIQDIETGIDNIYNRNPAGGVEVSKLDRQMADWQNRNTRASQEYMDEVSDYRETLRNGVTKEEFSAIITGFERTKAAAADAGSVGASFVEQLTNRVRSLGQYLLSFASFYRIISIFRKALTVVKELDTALTEMRKVSDESLATLTKYQFESFDMADKVGTTAKQIQESTADWLRLGRTFEQSKVLAEQSTVLLNVSEFQNIGEATEALVSATQAYDNLDSQSIIDKLNLIGNNFAVSTSDLAKGLQNTAAVLKTQGNDIDEALALLTAGNVIGQDISKASMGVRTISLRISGTEEAKDEIKDMGEDVDDFVVRTRSKTDSIIRDYTAVASNAYKGISVLDSNGNLRNTYDILLDISKIYKEIQEEDKKYGTNRAQALIETLAGKTRSNIAASILLNGDILEQVYQASQNDYLGSAEQENAKYLESIEGRIAKLQNRLQELAFTGFQSGTIKPIIDFLTTAVQLATQLVEQVGLLPALIGSIGGMVLQFTGHGINRGFGGLLSGITGNKFIKNTFGELKLSDAGKNFFATDEYKNAIAAQKAKGLSSNIIYTEQLASGGYGKVAGEVREYSDELERLGVKAVTVKQMERELSDTTFSLGSVIGGVKNIFAGFISTLGSMAVAMAAAFVIQAAIKGFSALLHHAENVIKAGEEAKSTMDAAKQSFDATKKSVEELSDEYAKLSTGVEIKGNTIKNINLSEEEFARYIELSNKIKELAPELVTGYTTQGDAIVNLGNTIDEVNGKFEEYIRIQEMIANGEYGSNLDAMWRSALQQEKDYNNQLTAIREEMENTPIQVITDVNDEVQSKITRNTRSFRMAINPDNEVKIQDILKEAGVTYNTPSYNSQSGMVTFSFDPEEIAKLSEDQMRAITDIINKSEFKNKGERQLLQAQQARIKLLLQKVFQDQVPYIQGYIKTNNVFDLMDDGVYAESLQQGLLDVINRIDFQSIEPQVQQKGGLQAWLDWFISSFAVADDDLKQYLTDLFELQENRADMAVGDYVNKMSMLLSKIQGKIYAETGYDFSTVASMFGWGQINEEGFAQSFEQTRATSAAKKLGIDQYGNAGDILYQRITRNGYSSEAFDSAMSAIERMTQSEAQKLAGDLDAIWEFLLPYLTGQIVLEKEPGTDTLEDVLGGKEFDASKYTSKLQAIETALSSLWENGFLSDKEKVTLQEALPDLTDFDVESIKQAGGDVLKSYISYIQSEADKYDLSDEAKTNLQSYIVNLAKSYASSISSNQDMYKILHDSVKTYIDENAPDEWKPRLKETETDQQYQDIIDALGDRLQSEDAATIMLLLEADGTLATNDIEAIVSQWDEYAIQLGITLNDEDEARIKRELSNIETAQGLSNAMITSAEANGGRATKGQRQQAYELAQDAVTKAHEYTQEKLADYSKAVSSGDEEYMQSMWNLVLEARTEEETKSQEALEALKEVLLADGNGMFEEEERLELTAEALQAQKEEEEKYGGKASDEVLDEIAQNAELRAENARALGDFFAKLAVSDEGKPFAKELLKTATEYYSKATGYDTDEFDAIIGQHQNNIDALEDSMQRLQATAQSTSDDMALIEAQGKEVGEAFYYDQIDEASDQIANLYAQRVEQIKLMQSLQGEDNYQDLTAYKDAESAVASLDSQIKQLEGDIFGYKRNIAELPLVHLRVDKTELEQEADRLQAELSDVRNAPTVDVYTRLIVNADEQKANLESEKAELERLMSAFEPEDFYSTQYQTYKSELAEIESQLESVTQSQLEWNKAILELPIDKVNQQLDEYARALERISAERELAEAQGKAQTQEDFLAEAELYSNEAALHANEAALRRLEAAKMVINGYAPNSEEVLSVLGEAQSQDTQAIQAKTNALNARRSAQELVIDQMQTRIDQLGQSAQELENVITDAEARGKEVTALDYQRLISNADAQIEQREAMIRQYEGLLVGQEEGSANWQKYTEGINSAKDAIFDLNQSKIEWREIMSQMTLTELQQEQADMEREMTVAQEEHRKISKRMYRELLKNGEKQIASLKKQQSNYGKMSTKYREIEDQIADVESAMREWEDAANHLASTAGQNLSSALTSALSEINSETGLTKDTMDSLLESFSDLSAYDLSGLFYESADGMKLNIGMAKSLIDAEYELTMSGLQDTIAEQNEIIRKNTGFQSENAQAAVAAAQLRKTAAEQEMAMYQALYDQQKEALSPYQAWQNATQTTNAGAKYETYQGAWKDIQEAFTKGLTGTDDFRTYVAFFDRWGQDTVEAYKRNKDKITRYVTEDSTGISNFIKDLVAKGYGTENDKGGYDVSLSDIGKIAQDLGMSEDATRMMINRGEDYGWIVTMADTVQEGELKVIDTTHDLIQETLRLQDMMSNGATEKEIENQQKYVDELKGTVGDYIDTVRQLEEDHGTISYSQLKTQYDSIKALKELMESEEVTEGMTTGELAKFKEEINDEIQRISDETGIPIKFDAKLQEFIIDEDKLQQRFDGFHPSITVDEVTTEKFQEARKELMPPPTLDEATKAVLGVSKNDVMGSTFDKLQNGWEDNKESVGEYIKQLNALTLSEEDIKNLEWLDFDDGGYTDGLEELEIILDNMRETFGITADEAEYLIPILEQLGLINITGGGIWNKPISAIMGVEVSALDQWIRDTGREDIDLNFDPTEMSVDELSQKIQELSAIKLEIEAGTDAEQQATDLITSLQHQLNLQNKIGRMVEGGTSIDDFLGLDEDAQREVMLNLGVNPKDFDDFIAAAQNQSIQVKIESALKDNTIEELLEMSDEDLAKELGIEADTESFKTAKEMLNDISMTPYKTAGQTIVEQISDGAYEVGTKIADGFQDRLYGEDSTPSNTKPATTETQTNDKHQYVPLAKEPEAPSSGIPSINQVVTEMSVVGAKESKAEVDTYNKAIDEIPDRKKTQIETEHIETTTTTNNVISQGADISDVTNNITKESKNGGTTVVNVVANVQGKEDVDELVSAIGEVHEQKVDVAANVHGSAMLQDLIGKIGQVQPRTVDVSASVHGSAILQDLINKINQLQDKRVVITTEHRTVSYTGSVTGSPSPYVAHASGTAYNMLNLTPLTEANAAGNDVSIQKTGKSLVNELGQESVIRDGKWYLLPGGMHVETLKKGDIVLNHMQTDALLHNRIAPGTGDLYGKFEDVVNGAYAGGTLGKALMPAHGYVTIQTGGDLTHSTGVGGGGGDTKIYVNTPSNTKSTASTDKGSLDNFKKWLEKLFDWIEVRVERVRYQIDLWQQRAEYRNGYQNKNAAIDQAVKLIGELGVYNKKKKKFTGGSGLLQDMQSGAKRYYEQANLVRQKALENKLFTKNSKGESAAKQIDAIIKKIQEGTININEYDEKVREFISAYKQWYDKGKDLQAQIEELKKQLKELEQTKLDNITEQFDTLVGYSEAVKSASEATVDYYNMVGNEVNGKYTKNQITTQIKAQSDAVDQLAYEYIAYNKELANAKKVFGANSNEYREAQTQLKNIQQSYVEARTALKELQETTARLDIQRIELYIDRLKEMGSRLSNVVSYGEARGTKSTDKNGNPFLTEKRYQSQYNNNIKLMYQYQQEIDKQNKLIEKFGYQMGSEKYNEAFQVIEQAEQEILSLAASNEQLQDSINTLRWKPFKDLETQIKNTISDVDYLRELMNEKEWFTEDAVITDKGYANIALIGDSLKKTKQLTADYAKALNKVQEEYENSTISLEEYNEKSREYIELLKGAVTDTNKYKDALVDMYKTQITMENDILQKSIDLRQKALQAKKSYYDYDKQLKDKSKDIINLQAQVNALSGVTNQAGQAERKRLMAQLQEAQEDLKDFQYDHRYDMINQGYETLSEDAQRNLDNTLEALERNADEQERVVVAMLDKIQTHYTDAYNGIQSIIEETGFSINDITNSSITSMEKLEEEITKLKENTADAMKELKEYAASTAVDNIKTTATQSTLTGKTAAEKEEAQKITAGAATAITNAAAGTGASTANTQAEKNATTNKSVSNPNTDLTMFQKAVNLIAGWKTKAGVSLTGHHALYNYVYQGGKDKSRRKNVTMSLANELALGNALDVKGLPKDASKLTSANKNDILKKLKAVGYKKGTKSLQEDDGRYWTHEGEIIIRKSDGAVLTPMTKGSTVIPANLADNLFKWGAIDPDKFFSNPFLRKKEDVNVSAGQPAPTIQVGSMFTIEGNVDAGVMDRLEDLGRALTQNRNFQQNVVNLVTKEYVRESRKLGIK